MKIFSERLRTLRIEKQLKQFNIANQLGILQQSYSDYETNTSEPDLETLCKLADIFDVSIDFLCGRVDEFDELFIARDESNKK